MPVKIKPHAKRWLKKNRIKEANIRYFGLVAKSVWKSKRVRKMILPAASAACAPIIASRFASLDTMGIIVTIVWTGGATSWIQKICYDRVKAANYRKQLAPPSSNDLG